MIIITFLQRFSEVGYLKGAVLFWYIYIKQELGNKYPTAITNKLNIGPMDGKHGNGGHGVVNQESLTPVIRFSVLN